jgi:DNA polymerase-3 subunit gamma/tau
MYQVLARKWRPQDFDAVVGQDAVTRTLRNALASGRVAHAYLLTGPRGVGKTTTARLLAKALACSARTGPDACGTCPSCVDVAAGISMDVLEIDAASNNGVEEIRTLRENVKYAPSRGRFKIYIVDEVHMLSGPAFNAFLKTLEEPPAHVVFVLATTDPRKIPTTVLSRCQRFDFKPIAPAQLAEQLTRILTEEKVPFEPSALPLLVRASEGSLRDALSLLDAAIAYGQGSLDETAVAELLGAAAPVRVRGFAAALLARDGGAALEAIDQVARAGEDLDLFCRDAIEAARRLLVTAVAPSAPFADLTPAEREELVAAAGAVTPDDLIYLLRSLLEAQTEMRRSPSPRVELEIAAVRIARRPEPVAIDALIAKVEEAEKRIRAGGPAPTATQGSLLDTASGGGSMSAAPRVAAAPPRTEPPAPRPDFAGPRSDVGALRSDPGAPRPEPAPRPELASPRAGSSTSPATAARPAPPAAGAPPSSTPQRSAAPAPSQDAPPPGNGVEGAAGDLAASWQRIVAEVMGKKALLGTVLQHATPVGVSDGALVVSLVGNPFHREMLADRGNREIIGSVVGRHLPGAGRIELSDGEGAGSGPLRHPTVQAAAAAFGGEVVAVRPRASEGRGREGESQ